MPKHDTDTPTGPGPAPFGVRLDAATLARLDAYAERIDKKRGGAAARVIAAGLDALEGFPVRAPAPAPGASPPPTTALDVPKLAAAIVDEMLSTMDVAAWSNAAQASSPAGSAETDEEVPDAPR